MEPRCGTLTTVHDAADDPRKAAVRSASPVRVLNHLTGRLVLIPLDLTDGSGFRLLPACDGVLYGIFYVQPAGDIDLRSGCGAGGQQDGSTSESEA